MAAQTDSVDELNEIEDDVSRIEIDCDFWSVLVASVDFSWTARLVPSDHQSWSANMFRLYLSWIWNCQWVWRLSLIHSKLITEEQDCIGRKSGYSNDYEWFSYNQVRIDCSHDWLPLGFSQTIFKMHSFGSGLVHIGCEPNNHSMMVLYGKNNFKVQIFDSIS